MPKKFLIYWYQEGPEFTQAFLYNLRDDDIQEGGRIAKGAIVQGKVGLVAAECEVFGWTGKTVPFRPNQRCKWQDFELPCMTSLDVSVRQARPEDLRDTNYAVAAITDDKIKALAEQLNVPPVKTPEGVWVINVELARFDRQGKERRATLI